MKNEKKLLKKMSFSKATLKNLGDNVLGQGNSHHDCSDKSNTLCETKDFSKCKTNICCLRIAF